MSTLLTAIGTWLVNLIRGWLGDARAAKGQRDAGRAEAEAEGQKRVSEVADRQTQRAAAPLDDDDVLKRLDGGTG